MSAHVTTVRIPADHPALPGHFPGRPIVPGVVLLDCVIAAAEQWLARSVRVSELQQAKFTQPLLPDQEAQLDLTLSAGDLRFVLARAGERIAQGVFKLESEARR